MKGLNRAAIVLRVAKNLAPGQKEKAGLARLLSTRYLLFESIGRSALPEKPERRPKRPSRVATG